MHETHPQKNGWMKWASGVALAFGLVASAHAQVLIQDGFSGSYNGLAGSGPDAANAANTAYTANDINRGVNTSYSGTPVAASYSGNNTVGGSIAFSPTGSAYTLTLSGTIYLQSSAENHQPNNGFTLGFTNGNVGQYVLAMYVNRDGSGTLYSGGVSQNFSAAGTFIVSNGTAGTAGTVGQNTFSIAYNSTTGAATLTEAGTQVAGINAGPLTLGNAGFGGSYINGWNNYSDPDSIDNFTLTQSVTPVPEPATYLAGALCLGWLLVRWRRAFPATA